VQGALADDDRLLYGFGMKAGLRTRLGFTLGLALLIPGTRAAGPEEATFARAEQRAFVLPIRDDIMPPLVYLVRRGVKEAMEAKADLLVLDVKTDGGRVDTTEEIIEILGQFKGQTVTYVNDRAFSAGAFIAVATQRIFMAPQSVIGAAAPIMLAPGGSGPVEMPDTMEIKMNSAVRALVRRVCEKNGHDVDVLEAMIDKTKELKRLQIEKASDGSVSTNTTMLKEKGDILTLTDTEAARAYGDPARPLLSAGTVESLDALMTKLGYATARRTDIKPTGAERLGIWINAISPLLLIIGILGVYIEFKTPGFGLPGIVGLAAFALYFLGGYIAGLSGMEWILVFLLGLVLVALELFVFPGSLVAGVAGAGLMLVALVMAMVDVYPGMPTLPSLELLRPRAISLLITFSGAAVGIWALSLILPRTSLYGRLVSQSASGVASGVDTAQKQEARVGQVGVALSPLRPGGKAQFGEQILDVMTQGEMIEKGQRVRILSHSGTEAVVEAVT
jgi:membrane-bound serine protease (ClpP class)